MEVRVNLTLITAPESWSAPAKSAALQKKCPVLFHA